MGRFHPAMTLLSLTLMSEHQLNRLLGHWGYALVFTIVALQSLGAPLPGTTALITASLYAASTHRLQIVGVILAAAVGVLAGSAVAFAVGRRGGAALLARYGHVVALTPERLRIGRYLFAQYGAKIVFFGRFITGLRNVVAFLAGTNRMSPPRFLGFCTAAAFTWAISNGVGYYLFGRALTHASTPINVALLAAFVASWAISAQLVRRRVGGIRLAAEADEQAERDAAGARDEV